jgi:hypothetical protein
MDEAKKSKMAVENEKMLGTIEAKARMPESQDVRSYLDTITKIRTKGRVDTTKLIVRDFSDHKNISLWTRWGKRIGPLHPHNAEVAFRQFFAIGIILSADEPTREQIEEYKQTDEYKAMAAKIAETRQRKEGSRTNVKELIEKFTKMSGQTIEAVNGLLKKEQLAPLSTGRANAGL